MKEIKEAIRAWEALDGKLKATLQECGKIHETTQILKRIDKEEEEG